MNNKTKNNTAHFNKFNTPQLRFSEFEGEWEKINYGDIYTFYSTNSLSRDKLNYKKGCVKNIHYGDIHTKFSTIFDIQKENVPFVNEDVELSRVPKENYCQTGDLVIADASEDYLDIGKTIEIINLNNENVIAGLHTFLARPIKNKMALGFSGYLLQTWNTRKQVMTIAQGTKVLGLSTKRLSGINLSIPTLPEQQKIASFLTAVDSKLQALKKKKKLLVQYKKGVMQRIFSQEIRFKDAGGKEFAEWEEKKLVEISSNIMYGMNASAVKFDGTNRYLRITDIDENTRQYIPNPITSPKGKIEDKYKLIEGDIVFTRTGASVGKSYLYKNEDGNLLFAGFLIRFSIKEGNPYFIYTQTLMESYNRWVISMSMRSGQPGINAEEYKSYKLQFPSLPEQTKIANFLSAIDKKITKADTQIEQTEQYKKGLLQQMFV